MTEQSVHIADVCALPYKCFKDAVHSLTERAGLWYELQENWLGGRVISVTVVISGHNPDAVRRFCEIFLQPVSQNPTRSVCDVANKAYRDDLNEWFTGEKAARESLARRYGLARC